MGKVKKKRRSNGDGKRIFRSPKGVHHVCRKKALAAPRFGPLRPGAHFGPKMNPGSASVLSTSARRQLWAKNEP